MKNLSSLLALATMGSNDMFGYMPQYKANTGTTIHVRTEPKIGRNVICPKCESGLKYKNCCMG